MPDYFFKKLPEFGTLVSIEKNVLASPIKVKFLVELSNERK